MAITTVGFAVTAMGFPMLLYTQTARGLTPTQSALLLVPMAWSPVAWPRWWAGSSTGCTRECSPRSASACASVSMLWLALIITRHPVVAAAALEALLGVANACMWAPLGGDRDP